MLLPRSRLAGSPRLAGRLAFPSRIGELPAEAPANVRSDWLAFHACVLGRFRDFDAAESYLRRAEEVCPDQPWTCLERAFLLELEDRYEESLAASRRALELRTWYRPGVQAAAHTLQLLDRDREALELLHEGSERIESGLLLAQLAALQSELGQHHDALRSYARFAELSPLLEKSMAEWLAAPARIPPITAANTGKPPSSRARPRGHSTTKSPKSCRARRSRASTGLLEVGFVASIIRPAHRPCWRR